MKTQKWQMTSSRSRGQVVETRTNRKPTFITYDRMYDLFSDVAFDPIADKLIAEGYVLHDCPAQSAEFVTYVRR